MKRLWLGILSAVLITGATQVAAQTRAVVVELFTSQGCSSCPPADALLHDLAKMDGVIPLALHVDYWDYIGWKDSFATPAFTERQRAYARAQHEQSIYTPQMMINGHQHVVGNRKSQVMAALRQHAGQPQAVVLSVKRQGGKIVINLSQSRGVGGVDIHVASYRDISTVDIQRGENAGKTISYANVVTGLQTVGKWNGQGAVALTTATPTGADGHVVIVQKQNHGEIIAAVNLR